LRDSFAASIRLIIKLVNITDRPDSPAHGYWLVQFEDGTILKKEKKRNKI
jgi:hypothetical protein